MWLAAPFRSSMRKALSFRGRAARSEFWALPPWMAAGGLALTAGVAGFAILATACGEAGFGFVPRGGSAFFSLLASACAAGCGALLLWGLTAMLSALVRRLHDVGLSGWLALPFGLLLFLPGFIVAILPSQNGPNAWGPPPAPVTAGTRRRFPWSGAACALLALWAALTAASFALDRLERRAVFAAFDGLSRHEAADLWAAPAVSVRSFSQGLDLVSIPETENASWNDSLSSWDADASLVCLRELRGTERVVAGFALEVPEAAEGRAAGLCADWLGVPLADPTEADADGLLADADRPDGRRTLVFFKAPDPDSGDPTRMARFCILLHSVDETIAALVASGDLPLRWIARIRDPAVRGRTALRIAMGAPESVPELTAFFPEDDATLVAFLREDLLAPGRTVSAARTERLFHLALNRLSDQAAPDLAEMLRDHPDLPPKLAGDLLARLAAADAEAAFGAARRLFLAALERDLQESDPKASRTLVSWEQFGNDLRDDDFLRDVLLRRLSWCAPPEAADARSNSAAVREKERKWTLTARVTETLLPAFSDERNRRAVVDEILRFGSLRANAFAEWREEHPSENDLRNYAQSHRGEFLVFSDVRPEKGRGRRFRVPFGPAGAPPLLVFAFRNVPRFASPAPPPAPTVSTAPGASYGFRRLSDGWYESQNKGVRSSAAAARVRLSLSEPRTLTVEFVNHAEARYDYGVFGKLDHSISTDRDILLSCNDSSRNGSHVQRLTYEVPAGDHYFDVKFLKDSSQDSNADSLRFHAFFEEEDDNEPYVSVESVPGATYGFSRQNGWFESRNKGVHNSCALARVRLSLPEPDELVIEFINDAEAGYDYGLFGMLDRAFSTSYNDNSDAKLSCSDSSHNRSSVQRISYRVPAGRHFIDVKFRKDGSNSSGADTLRFRTSLPSAEAATMPESPVPVARLLNALFGEDGVGTHPRNNGFADVAGFLAGDTENRGALLGDLVRLPANNASPQP